MRYVRPPYPIHPRAEVCEGIFARLDDLLDMELAKFKGQRPSVETRILRDFYEWARETLDANQYADIQARLIDGSKESRSIVGPIKFLTFLITCQTRWLTSFRPV